MFENVKTGDAFKTECGKKAFYWYQAMSGAHVLIMDNCQIVVDKRGKHIKHDLVLSKGFRLFSQSVKPHDCDVVGKWIED